MMSTALLFATLLSLNGSWEFRFEEGKSIDEVGKASFTATDTIPVPGCFDALPKWLMKRGTGLYRKTFFLDRAVDAAGLTVDGLGLCGKFWIDGREIGVDDLPWSRVELPTGPLAAGAHTVVAAVDNRFAGQKLAMDFYDFHCWGGFFHGVSLSFDNRRLFVRTRSIATGEVEIEVSDGTEGERTLVFDGTNEVRATFRRGRATVRVPDFRIWSPEHPNLHTVALDPRLSARFGLRTIEARDGGLYLNGKRIFLKGANRHDQQLPAGAATSESVMLADIQNLKAIGGNFFRGAHYPQSQRFLDLCDENGVLVWEESLGWGNGPRWVDGVKMNELTDAGFADAQLRQTRLMVRNSFNHPSVIIFAFLNECRSDLPECKVLVDRLIGAIRELDSGRLVTFACNQIEKDICNENTDLIAINTYPGTINGNPGTHEELRERIHNMKAHGVDWATEHLAKRYPGKTIVISEMGVAGLYGVRDASAAFYTEDFQDEHNNLVAEAAYGNPRIAGLAYWQFFDTRTSWRDCGPNGKKPRAMSAAGLFDAQRRPKIGVRTVTDWFRNRTPANLEDCK